MHCRDVEERLQELLDDRRDPLSDFELADHAVVCADCQAVLEAQSKLFDGLRLRVVPSLPANFSQRVVGTVVTRRRQPAPRLASVAACLAIIATLLLVVSLGPRPAKRVVPTDDGKAIAAVTLSESIEGGARGLSMTDFDSREVRLAIEHFVARLNIGDSARFYQVDQLAGTIRPLASTLNVAFDAIRRSIPSRRQKSHAEPQARDLSQPWVWLVI